MNRYLLIILIAAASCAHTAKGQQRGSGNTSGRTGSSPSLRSGSANSLSPSGSVQRQQPIPRTSEWNSMNMQEKKEIVNNMTVKDRSAFLQKMKENIVIGDLDIANDKQEEFKNLYAEYQSNQKAIKEKFLVDNNVGKLSPEEATRRLNHSFEVGQQLLDNRKNYAEKFLKILSPQQVLTLFQTEGKMRDKMLDKKNDK